LVEAVRRVPREQIDPCSLEYFDRRSLNRLRKKFNTIPERAHAALFFENDVDRMEDYDSGLEAWFEFLSRAGVLFDDSWFAQSASDLNRFYEFRHEIPAMLNEENSRFGRVKMGTDMAVPEEQFIAMMKLYRAELEAGDLDYVVFGHLGDNHLHINLLPDSNQIQQAEAVCKRLVGKILEWQGTVSAEHGVGKLKKKIFAEMVGSVALSELKAIKMALDPRMLLGCGNIF
jgi:D-lactate dehydrogenase (cytochrome)